MKPVRAPNRKKQLLMQAEAAERRAAIDALRLALMREPDLSRVFALFMDLSDTPGFIELGSLGSAPRVATALAATAALAAPATGDARLSDLCPLRLREHCLTHGTCQLGGRLAGFFYFDDLDAGVVGIYEGGHRMRYARLTLTTVPAGTGALMVCPRPPGPQ